MSPADAFAAAQSALERVPRAIDALECVARWDAATTSVLVKSVLPDEATLLVLDDTPTDLCAAPDGVLYLALPNAATPAVRMHDLRGRWNDVNVSLAGFVPWRLAPAADGGVWALERSTGRIARLTGRPMRTETPQPDDYDPRVFRPDPENACAPRLALIGSTPLDVAETPVAIAGGPDGALALLSLDRRHRHRARPPLVVRRAPIRSAADAAGRDLCVCGRVARAGPRRGARARPSRRAGLRSGRRADRADAAGRRLPAGHRRRRGPLRQRRGAAAALSGRRGQRGAAACAVAAAARAARRGAPLRRQPFGPRRPHDRQRRRRHGLAPSFRRSRPARPHRLRRLARRHRGSRAAGRRRPARLASARLRRGHPQLDDAMRAPQVPIAVWEPTPSELPHHPGLLGGEREAGVRGLFSVLVQNARQRVRTLSGRYLWLRLVLHGDTRATPEIAALRVRGSRFSYADRYLPRLYRESLFGAAAQAPGERVGQIDTSFAAALDAGGAPRRRVARPAAAGAGDARRPRGGRGRTRRRRLAAERRQPRLAAPARARCHRGLPPARHAGRLQRADAGQLRGRAHAPRGPGRRRPPAHRSERRRRCAARLAGQLDRRRLRPRAAGRAPARLAARGARPRALARHAPGPAAGARHRHRRRGARRRGARHRGLPAAAHPRHAARRGPERRTRSAAARTAGQRQLGRRRHAGHRRPRARRTPSHSSTPTPTSPAPPPPRRTRPRSTSTPASPSARRCWCTSRWIRKTWH